MHVPRYPHILDEHFLSTVHPGFGKGLVLSGCPLSRPTDMLFKENCLIQPVNTKPGNACDNSEKFADISPKYNCRPIWLTDGTITDVVTLSICMVMVPELMVMLRWCHKPSVRLVPTEVDRQCPG